MRRAIYTICDRATPHIAVLTAATLEGLAEALASQDDRDTLVVYANVDGFSRELSMEEQQLLDELTCNESS